MTFAHAGLPGLIVRRALTGGAALALAATALAVAPSVTTLTPAGGQRGSEVEVILAATASPMRRKSCSTPRASRSRKSPIPPTSR